MLDGLRDLVELSSLDSELSELNQELAALPAKQLACAEERAAALERLESARVAVTEADQAQRRAEAEAQDQQAELARLEGQQYQVKTNAAYSALLAEMEQARRAISDAETRVLEAMEAIESAGSSQTTLEELVQGVGDRLDAEEREHEARAKALEVELGALQERRDTHGARIEKSLLARYEKIAARRTPAVAIVSGEICLGCRVGIPPQSFIDILKGEQIVTCETCQRILVDEDQLRSTG